MRCCGFMLALLVAGLGWSGRPRRERKGRTPLRVLYVGNTETDRGRSYAKFLGETFTLVKAVDRKTFDPEVCPGGSGRRRGPGLVAGRHRAPKRRGPGGIRGAPQVTAGRPEPVAQAHGPLGQCRALARGALEGLWRKRVNVPGAFRVRATRPPHLPVADRLQPRQPGRETLAPGLE